MASNGMQTTNQMWSAKLQAINSQLSSCYLMLLCVMWWVSVWARFEPIESIVHCLCSHRRCSRCQRYSFHQLLAKSNKRKRKYLYLHVLYMHASLHVWNGIGTLVLVLPSSVHVHTFHTPILVLVRRCGAAHTVIVYFFFFDSPRIYVSTYIYMKFIFCLGKWKNRGRHHYHNTKYTHSSSSAADVIWNFSIVKRLKTE